MSPPLKTPARQIVGPTPTPTWLHAADLRYSYGLELVDIAQELGVDVVEVELLLQEHEELTHLPGWEPDDDERPPVVVDGPDPAAVLAPGLTEAQQARILALYEDGYEAHEIARRVARTKVADVERFLTEEGL